MRVAVTGGAGFIGANLCGRLLGDPDLGEVVVVDDLSTGDSANLRGCDVVFNEGTIVDAAWLAGCFVDVDAVVHLAARPSVPRSLADPVASHTVNATGTVNVLEAARAAGVGHVIVASSSSVYGANPALPKSEELATVPLSPYAASKLATEAYALAYAHSFGMSVLALRFFNVFGPLQTAGHAYAAVVPTFVDAALSGKPLPIHGDGKQTRDFTFVGSVVDLIAAALRDGVSSDGPVNLAFGTRTSILDLVDELGGVIGHPLEREHLPSRAGDVRDSQADTTRLRALFPNAEPVSLRDGLQQTVAWFRSL